jgi:hypothetical protein
LLLLWLLLLLLLLWWLLLLLLLLTWCGTSWWGWVLDRASSACWNCLRLLLLELLLLLWYLLLLLNKLLLRSNWLDGTVGSRNTKHSEVCLTHWNASGAK